MKEYYTMQEIQLFPGLSPAVIKGLCAELSIQREKKDKEELRSGKGSYVLTRKQLEILLNRAGWELVKINRESYWIRYKMKDF